MSNNNVNTDFFIRTFSADIVKIIRMALIDDLILENDEKLKIEKSENDVYNRDHFNEILFSIDGMPVRITNPAYILEIIKDYLRVW
jgi:hypothetical protein